MSKNNFQKVHPWVLAHEGGYVNHPKDPGGATNFGVTQRTYDAYRKLVGLQQKSVRHISATERDAIYKSQYWDKLMCDQLPSGVDYAVYDFGVNSGVNRSAKYLQRVVGVRQDGVIGMETLAAVSRMGSVEIITQLCKDRMAFLRRARDRKGNLLWPTFGKGWTRRVVGRWEGYQEGDHGVIDRATLLASGTKEVPAPRIVKDGSGERTTGGKQSFWSMLMTLFTNREG